MEPAEVEEHELHWLAGLLEGEGSFMPGPPSDSRMPIIAVAMTDEDVIRRAAMLLGPKPFVVRPARPHWRTSYQVRLRGSGAVAWMLALRPLLGKRRRAQIDRALACYEPRTTAILYDGTAAQAIADLASGSRVKDVAAKFGVTIWCIYDLKLGRTFRHLARPDGLKRER